MAVFADTHYWVAVANRADQWSGAAAAAESRLDRLEIVTTEEVLAEFLGFMSDLGAFLRTRRCPS